MARKVDPKWVALPNELLILWPHRDMSDPQNRAEFQTKQILPQNSLILLFIEWIYVRFVTLTYE